MLNFSLDRWGGGSTLDWSGAEQASVNLDSAIAPKLRENRFKYSATAGVRLCF